MVLIPQTTSTWMDLTPDQYVNQTHSQSELQFWLCQASLEWLVSEDFAGKSLWFIGQRNTAAPRPPAPVLMGTWWKRRWTRETPSFLSPASDFSSAVFLLAPKWRFAVWLLGTVGQCSQSSVCSLACAAPRVSLAPEGRQTKRHHCLSHWRCSPTHSSSLLNGGTLLFRGGKWQRKYFFFFFFRNRASG